MVGIMSGAVTNTPGLGAAQQAVNDMGQGDNVRVMAMGYAVAYPLGVIGIILSMILVKKIFKIDFTKENNDIEALASDDSNSATAISLQVENPAICGKNIRDIKKLFPDRDFIISRYWSNQTNEISLATPDTVLQKDDKIFVILTNSDVETVSAQIGKEIPMERRQWVRQSSQFINRRIIVSKPEINGKHLGSLSLRKIYGCNITRVNRSGVDLVASKELILQIGDTLSVVGTEASIAGVEKVIGNSMGRLNHPNLIAWFIGIALGGQVVRLLVAGILYGLTQILVVDLVAVLALYGLANLLSQLHLDLAVFLDFIVSGLHGTKQVSLANLLHLTLNHHDVVICGGNHHVHIGLFKLLEGGVYYVLSVYAGYTDLRNGSLERYIRYSQSC